MRNKLQLKLGGLEKISPQLYEHGPPEWDAQLQATKKSDIYQLGQLLHYLIFREYSKLYSLAPGFDKQLNPVVQK